MYVKKYVLECQSLLPLALKENEMRPRARLLWEFNPEPGLSRSTQRRGAKSLTTMGAVANVRSVFEKKGGHDKQNRESAPGLPVNLRGGPS